MEGAGAVARHSSLLYAEQVALLYGSAPFAYSVTLVNGAILAFVERAYVSTPALISWYGALVLVTILRSAVVRRYRRVKPGADAARTWNLVYVAGTGLAGAVWGASALVMVPSTSLAHEVFVAFVLAGMAAGSITVLAFRMEACVAFLLPALLPLVFSYLTRGTTLHTVMGVMSSMFLVGMVISASTFNRSVRSALMLRFDKRELEEEVARRDRAEKALLLERDRLRTVLASIGEGVALVDAGGRIEFLNRVAERICACSSDRALGRQASLVFEAFERDGQQRTSMAMEDALRAARRRAKQILLKDGGGQPRVIEDVATPLYDAQRKVAGAVSILRDVTDLVAMTEQLAHAADHDALTGLPNRSLLQSRLEQAIARGQRRQERFALLFLDLDRFKEVNDTLGHAAGDALLVEAARRLCVAVREEDTVARLGGDEFVVLLEGPIETRHVQQLNEKIAQVLREPYRLGAQWAVVAASIGVSLYPDDGGDAETLIGCADAAMYRAKRG